MKKFKAFYLIFVIMLSVGFSSTLYAEKEERDRESYEEKEEIGDVAY